MEWLISIAKCWAFSCVLLEQMKWSFFFYYFIVAFLLYFVFCFYILVGMQRRNRFRFPYSVQRSRFIICAIQFQFFLFQFITFIFSSFLLRFSFLLFWHFFYWLCCLFRFHFNKLLLSLRHALHRHSMCMSKDRYEFKWK